ncbi:unnamed protein product [Pleuronectes platessa]|uniref:Uncharacterized protein n=1 Tax=Pleuronectes platessa TaxID=8262 RepID=A0A9N7UTK6_PLEPL|nr:unnamed protein product [Pleuronectes platessa]
MRHQRQSESESEPRRSATPPSPSQLSTPSSVLKYYPRNEIRDPEYRVRGSFGSRMETRPDSVAKRRPASPSPSGMAKYLPSSTWLSRRIHSAPFPSLGCSAQQRQELARSSRQGAKAATKSFSRLP